MKNYYLGKSIDHDTYEIGTNKREWSKYSGFPYFNRFNETLMALANVRLKPGQIKKIESIKFKLRDV